MIAWLFHPDVLLFPGRPGFQVPEQSTYVTSDRSSSLFFLSSLLPLSSFPSVHCLSLPFIPDTVGIGPSPVFCRNDPKALVQNCIFKPFVRIQVADGATISSDYIRVKYECTCIAWWQKIAQWFLQLCNLIPYEQECAPAHGAIEQDWKGVTWKRMRGKRCKEWPASQGV